MTDELNQAIEAYKTKWQALGAVRKNKDFFGALAPTSVGWKTTDLADFDTRFAALRAHASQIHLGWVNGRWLATLYMNDALAWDIRLVKLMQRRPESSDPVGLDHLDFYNESNDWAREVLAAEPDLKWTEEKNGEHCKWLSLWFAGTEAKLRSDTVLDVCIAELQDIKQAIGAGQETGPAA